VLRFYLDEDSMSAALVRALRARGADVETAREAGLVERSDAEHLAYATAAGRVLCTFNVGDFHRLHGEWLDRGEAHAGMILMAQQRFSVGEQVRRLLGIAAERPSETMRGQVVFASTWR
jgi:hypothetical protein